MLGKLATVFQLYGENYETWTETECLWKQVADTIEEKGYTPEEKYTFKYIEGYDAKTPTQVISKFLKVRRNMIGKIQTISWRMLKLREMMRQSYLYYVLLVPMELQLPFVLLWAPMTTTLTSWNNGIADNNVMWKRGKPKISQRSLYGENFNGDLTQFKDIDKEMSYSLWWCW